MSSSSTKKKRRTQKDYTLLTQEEQCLRNPDMYVGSVNVEKNNDHDGHDWPYYYDGVLVQLVITTKYYYLHSLFIVLCNNSFIRLGQNEPEIASRNYICQSKHCTVWAL